MMEPTKALLCIFLLLMSFAKLCAMDSSQELANAGALALPPEVINSIAQYCGKEEKIALKRCCKYLNSHIIFKDQILRKKQNFFCEFKYACPELALHDCFVLLGSYELLLLLNYLYASCAPELFKVTDISRHLFYFCFLILKYGLQGALGFCASCYVVLGPLSFKKMIRHAQNADMNAQEIHELCRDKLRSFDYGVYKMRLDFRENEIRVPIILWAFYFLFAHISSRMLAKWLPRSSRCPVKAEEWMR